MRAARAGVALLAVLIALLLQVTVFGYLSWHGVVPNLCLLVVVGAALARGPQFAMLLGFVAGLLVDLAPPADNVAGRWALALVIVGYVAGRVRRDVPPSALGVVGTVAGASFVGTSVFALTGLVLADPALPVPQMLGVIGVGVLWDVLLTPFVLPALIAAFNRLDPEHGRVLA